MRQRLYEILNCQKEGDLPRRLFDIFIVTLIFLNVLAVVLETVASLSAKYSAFFHVFELVSVIIFTIEYVLRIWTCTFKEGYKHPVTGRIKFVLMPLALIDLFAILPFYLPMLISLDLRFIRAVRLLRLFRLLKIGRYSRSLKILGKVIKVAKEDLLIVGFAALVVLTIASSVIYFAEHEAQPELFSSIPAAMWWGVITLTTVGYGDICPVTVLGKTFAGIIAVLGVGLFALPTGIIASAFIEVVHKVKGKENSCPHCGKDIFGQENQKPDQNEQTSAI